MHTFILSDEEVAAYARDFLRRWKELGAEAPTVWFALGISGDKLVEVFLHLLEPQDQCRITFHRIGYDRSGSGVQFREGDSTGPIFPESALLVDGPVHSGASMLNAARWLLANGVKTIASYGLVVKKTSEFIPTYFGLMIGEHARAYFQLDSIPNHRLQKRPPFGVFRTISADDVRRPRQTLDTGVPSLDKLSLADLYYTRVTQSGHHVYVFELGGEVAGFVHFYEKGTERIVVDAIAVDSGFREKGIGAALIRWVENWARHHLVVEINLYGIEDRLDFYNEIGFSKADDPPLDLGPGETYHKLRKRILYNIRPKDEAA